MRNKIKTPKGWSIERVEHKNNELIVVYQKDIKNKDGSISQIVPISVIQGL